MVSNWTRDKRDTNGTYSGGAAAFTITNWTADVALDCNAAAVAETNDVLGTLIKILIEKGIITGKVTV